MTAGRFAISTAIGPEIAISTRQVAGVLTVAAAAGLASCGYALAEALGLAPAYRVANTIGPAVVLASCLGGASLMIQANRLAIWSPMMWFFVAYGVFFGFGPLSYRFASPETVAYMDALHPVTEITLLHTNLLNSIALGAASITALLIMICQSSKVQVCGAPAQRTSITLAIVFLLVGLPVKYFLLLPYNLKLFDFVVPALLKDLGYLTLPAMMLFFALRNRLHLAGRGFLYLLIVSEAISAVVTLSKLAILSVVLALMLGEYLRTRNLRSFVVAGIAVAALYTLVLSPLVTVLRVTVNVSGIQDVSQVSAATEEVESIHETYADLNPNVQGWWSRLTYSNVQAFAMERYRAGKPGSTFDLIPWAPVPRLLYPEKPEMTPGYRFTEEIYSRTLETSIGLGVFAEAYWNGGWPFVLMTAFYVAGLLTLLGGWAMRVVAAGNWYFAPALLNGVMLGLGVTGWTAATYVGGALYVILMIGALSLAGRLLRPDRLIEHQRIA